MIRLLREYINYWLKAKNRHGVHSPFVYQFNDECLSLKIPNETKRSYLDYYKKLRDSDRKIKVHDFGAGSKKLDSIRQVKSIAKVSGSSLKYASLIYRMVKFYQPKRILELGTSLGLSTLMMRHGSQVATIDTVEGCPNTHKTTLDLFPADYQDNIRFHQFKFDTYLTNINKSHHYDMVFIDGDHRGKSVLKMLDELKPFIHEETIILLDDIRWSADMQEMWEDVIASKKYHVTIDLFKLGVLVPRNHQATEHFVIRY